MNVYLVNPSHVSFGIGVITPRWLYVLAAATPASHGVPRLIDETLELFDTAARAAGAYVVFGGIHASLFPDEARELGRAHAVVTGDGERAWPDVLRDCAAG